MEGGVQRLKGIPRQDRFKIKSLEGDTVMAITSKSTLRDVLKDPRAVAIIEEYVPGFVEEEADLLGACPGYRNSTCC